MYELESYRHHQVTTTNIALRPKQNSLVVRTTGLYHWAGPRMSSSGERNTPLLALFPRFIAVSKRSFLTRRHFP